MSASVEMTAQRIGPKKKKKIPFFFFLSLSLHIGNSVRGAVALGLVGIYEARKHS
jgi:hypothetical protein